MNEEQCAGGIIFNPSHEVLVVCNKGLTWSFPKGHIENGEDIVTAAFREIKEETGLDKADLTLIKSVPSYSRPTFDPERGYDHDRNKTIHLFIFKASRTDVKPIDPDNTDARWVEPRVAEYILSNPGDILVFKKALSELPEIFS
ncbi:MAG: NUDIX domain-containing protein [Patescibacteria group bacterium]